jgi:hypothetical protein
MDKPVADVQGLSIVLRGHFNPAIITYGWLLAQKLISVEDFADTKPGVATADISNFQAPWFQCNATSDLLQISTLDPAEFEATRDLTVGILRALPHTPVGAMGINHDFHYRVETDDEWHALGDALAPKEPWGETLKLPGTLSLQMLGVRKDDQAGTVRVVVEPSNRVSPYGIYIGYNDHFSLSPESKQPERRQDLLDTVHQTLESVEPSADKGLLATELLSSNWIQSLSAATDVVRQIRSITGGKG